MMNTQMTTTSTGALEMRWLPVVDARGRSHMEARWVLVQDAPAVAVTHAA